MQSADLTFFLLIFRIDFSSTESMPASSLLHHALDGKRLSADEALSLYETAPFLALGAAANTMAEAKNGSRASYLIDGNINYTNICNVICRFCAFYRHTDHKEAWELTLAQLTHDVQALIDRGATQVLLQGGLHPEYKVDYYVRMVAHLVDTFPGFGIHAFSPPEIVNIARLSDLSLYDVLQALWDAGMRTMPGGGAEILVDRVRDRLSIGKCTSDEWLAVMRTAHRIGMKTTATMMFGHVETIAERIAHLERLRQLQDETGGFISFIPWTFQPENTALHPRLKKNHDVTLVGSHGYLKMLALSRLYLDNIDHLQVSCLTQGSKIGQLGLLFGADDLGSVMLEERVVSSAGCEKDMTVPGMMAAIIELGKHPDLTVSPYCPPACPGNRTCRRHASCASGNHTREVKDRSVRQ